MMTFHNGLNARTKSNHKWTHVRFENQLSPTRALWSWHTNIGPRQHPQDTCKWQGTKLRVYNMSFCVFQKIGTKLALKALRQINSFIDRFHESDKTLSYNFIIDENIVSLMFLDDFGIAYSTQIGSKFLYRHYWSKFYAEKCSRVGKCHICWFMGGLCLWGVWNQSKLQFILSLTLILSCWLILQAPTIPKRDIPYTQDPTLLCEAATIEDTYIWTVEGRWRFLVFRYWYCWGSSW